MGLYSVFKKEFSDSKGKKWYSYCDGEEGLQYHKPVSLHPKEKCPICQKARDERKAKSLKRSALSSAKFRGHKMGKFTNAGKGEYVSLCKICNKGILVIVNPLPNETEILGGAVAVECTKKEGEPNVSAGYVERRKTAYSRIS